MIQEDKRAAIEASLTKVLGDWFLSEKENFDLPITGYAESALMARACMQILNAYADLDAWCSNEDLYRS